MAKHIWKFKIKKSSLGFSASGKHGNKNIVWSLKGYNTEKGLKREVLKKFPDALFI